MPLDGESREDLTAVPTASDRSSPSDRDLSYSDFRFDQEADRVGEGGNAVVYRAQLPDEGLTVALKEPTSGKTVPTETVERLRSEGEQWARIDDHPYVAGVVDWGVVPKPWIAIEYLNGGTLSEYVESASLEQRLWTAYAIVDGKRLVVSPYAHIDRAERCVDGAIHWCSGPVLTTVSVPTEPRCCRGFL